MQADRGLSDLTRTREMSGEQAEQRLANGVAIPLVLVTHHSLERRSTKLTVTSSSPSLHEAVTTSCYRLKSHHSVGTRTILPVVFLAANSS